MKHPLLLPSASCPASRTLRRFAALLLLPAVLTLAAAGGTEPHKIDSGHSAVGFSIRHLLVKLPGQFTKFEGIIHFDRTDPERSSVEATIAVASIETFHAGRNRNLLGADFFDASNFPVITFRSTAWKKTGEGKFAVTGDLEMRGVTKSIVLKAHLLGIVSNPDGSVLSGWDVTGKVNRNDFGVLGPQNLIANNTLGDEVGIALAIEARHRPASAP